ncbi:xanthine permease [Oleidesulfovibrio alaskensis G20]|jgi:NCS2 family nucleobase:cation symporter-2|uniref:Xanthine permease n=1 Tax=Oleidesulfovibrio alaskensis (strain ATCC BAA-1058 / DSM 17464 / G20) TaxID=207559 RepID=Q314Z4_OLEA2|nr:nucleobase:cation symporter-2 family protein [Oleidesulfovibrio alaskensis]ABB37502.1 xanthine permease [Oleidesulfovibrio alaskensis G20]MBG0773197.1 purine permease [Oleidesulfovibrio alaskensis]MBL3581407.1 purine permease [Oleidesulfovibrio alaskensis]
MSRNTELHLTVGVDEPVSPLKAFALGLQHVLAMDVYIAPFVMAGLLSLSVPETATFIQMTFVAAGLATLIQAGFGIRLPVMQGPSYVPIGALAAIGNSLGLGAMFGSLLPGALVMTLLGKPLRVFSRIVRFFIPPLVGGTVIVIVGIALMPVALKGCYGYFGDPAHNAVVALVSAAVLVVLTVAGSRPGRFNQVVRMGSVVFSMAAGTLTAAAFGMVNFDSVAAAPWLALPVIFPYGTPHIDVSAALTLVFIYLVVLVETTGTWFAVEAVTGSRLDDERINGGTFGEGVGCFLGAMLGGTPVTGYSTNAGIIAITGVASRWAIMAGGGILLVLGMVPKLMNVIASIPGPVISGVFAVICVVIAMNGFRVVRTVTLSERNMLVMGLPILLTLAAVFMPAELRDRLPALVRYLVESGIAVGAVSAVVLNLILPKDAE